jgi:hypothetical protein
VFFIKTWKNIMNASSLQLLKLIKFSRLLMNFFLFGKTLKICVCVGWDVGDLIYDLFAYRSSNMHAWHHDHDDGDFWNIKEKSTY